MKSRSLSALAVLSLAAAVSAQSGRTTTLSAPALIGTTFNVQVNYPLAATGNIYGFMYSAPFPGSITLPPVPPFTFVGDIRVDPFANTVLGVGIYLGSGQETMPITVPNTLALVGAGLDVQAIDVDVTQTFYLADTDAQIAVVPGIGNIEITSATTTSTTAGNNNLMTIGNANVGSPTSYGQPLFSYLATRHRGDEGFVEGYAGTFTGTSHNSDIDSGSYRRVGRRTAHPAYQTIGTPNGYEIAIIRDLTNGKQFSLTSYNRATGITTVIPGSTWLDTSTTSTTPAQQNFYFGFSRNGVWGAIAVKDSNTTTPSFAGKLWAFRTDGTQPVIDITPAGVAVTSSWFDGSIIFSNDFLLCAGSYGWWWTSATNPGVLQPLTLPNITSNNLPNVRVYTVSWRVSPDGSTIYFPIDSNTTTARVNMDMVKITNNGGVPLAVNYTQFTAATGFAEFGYSAISPSTTNNNSSNGIKCSVSPDSQKVAFMPATTVVTTFPGIYVADGTPNPTLYTVPGAVYYSEMAFINNTTVLFFAGAVPAAGVGQGFYKLDLTAGNQAGVITQIGTATDHRTRGSWWSLNKQFWYFQRSNFNSTLNDIVGVNCATGVPFSVTGTEFGTPGPVGTIRTGAFNLTTDPWPMLELQHRRAPVGNYAYFTARLETGVAGQYSDANLFRYDIENGGQAVNLTNYTTTAAGTAGTGTLTGLKCLESLTISDDGNWAAWSERVGNTSTATSPEVVKSMNLTTSVITQNSASQASQTITDGTIRFVGGANPFALVWTLGTGTATTVPTANQVVQFATLGSASPTTISAPPSGTRYYNVIGTH